MASMEQLHRAWHRVAENRIRSAHEEGQFTDLPGFGRPLEDVVDIQDPNGWIRRLVNKEASGINLTGIPTLQNQPAQQPQSNEIDEANATGN